MTTPPDPPDTWGTQAAMPSCVRHPDRPTGLRCTRCDRPACPECLREASVGYQCVDCVNEGRRTIRRATNVAGVEPSNRLVVMPVLILINVVVFAITASQAQSIGNNQFSELFAEWVAWPPLIADGDWHRMVTSGFLHYGPVHLVVNMISLYILGRELEPLLGWLRFTAVYVVSLLGTGIATFLFEDVCAGGAGASGGIFGLMGGLVVVLIRQRINPAMVLGVIALNVYISLTIPNISLIGHLGGLVVGAVATAAIVYAPLKSRGRWQAGALIGLAVALVGLYFVRDAQFGDVDVTAYLIQCSQRGG